jgi:D-amino peptidase
MKVYLSMDMEGVAGVVHVDQTRRTGHDYERARVWMTAEANAAALGAFDGGATAVTLNDSHGDMRNLLLEELDRRLEIVSGSLKPGSMVAGVGGHGCALFVGYHAGAGTKDAILDHTYNSMVAAGIRLNGAFMSETALNALYAGHFGVPVVLVTGDGATCADAREVLGDVETVSTKDALGRYTARSLHPTESCARIRDAARRAVERARAGRAAIVRGAWPAELEMDVLNAGMADACELVPGTDRLSGLTVGYCAPDAPTMLRVLMVWTRLAGTTIV